MYKVEWTEPAIEDLFTKVKTKKISDALLRVSEISLEDYHPPDGGQTDQFFWRRGLTRDERVDLEALEDHDIGDQDEPREQPWNFILVYRQKRSLSSRKTYVIIAVLRLEELVDAYVALSTHPNEQEDPAI